MDRIQNDTAQRAVVRCTKSVAIPALGVIAKCGEEREVDAAQVSQFVRTGAFELVNYVTPVVVQEETVSLDLEPDAAPDEPAEPVSEQATVRKRTRKVE